MANASAATRLLGGTDTSWTTDNLGPERLRPAAGPPADAGSHRDSARARLPQLQGVGCVQSSYLQALQKFQAAIVVEIVAVATSKRQRASPSGNAKLLNLKWNSRTVSTGGPMCPRRMERSCKSSLFSTTCDTRSCCRPVEALWSPVEPGGSRQLQNHLHSILNS